MCGRFVGITPPGDLMKYFPIDVVKVDFAPNYNVAPTQKIPAIVRHDDRNHLEMLYWGLVPFWAKDTTIGSRMINARAETAASKPAFRAAFRKRRCLIPADGFYEWKGAKGDRQPMYLTLPDRRPLALAGLWEIWDDGGNAPTPLRTVSILTRKASGSVREIHDRMPVILKAEAFDSWLDPANQDPEKLQDILENRIHTDLVSVAVSKQVNSVKNNRPENLEPVEGDRPKERE